MLGFVMDMISTMGANIKQILDPLVAKVLFERIYASKVEKYMVYAKECEDVR